MSHRNSYYAGDPFAETAHNSFIVPIQQSNSSQGSNSSNLHLGTSSLSLGGQAGPESSRTTYRYSTSVEAGDYRHQGAQFNDADTTQRSSRQVHRQPSFGQLSAAGSQASSGSGVGVSRSVSIGAALSGGSGSAGAGGASRSRGNSSTRMAYSPTTSGGDTNMSTSVDNWAHSPRTDSLQQGGGGHGHYRASPSLSSAPATSAGGMSMRRGLSYDGTYAAGPGHGLLPTSYQPRSGPGQPYSPMTGVQSAGYGSPSASPNPVPHPPPPPTVHRHSYSPSHYAASASSSQPAPPPLSSSYNSAPSFYAHHIPSTSASAPPVPSSHNSSSAPSPAPPSSRTPNLAHQPQAQLYYQSQQYFDQTLKRQQAAQLQAQAAGAAAGQAGGSATAAGSQQSSSTSPTTLTSNVNQASAFYPSHLPSSSSMSAPSTAHAGNPVPSSSGGVPSSSASSSGKGKGKGLRRVRDVRDIPRRIVDQPQGRRADPAGGFVSPLKSLTLHLPQTYHLINPSFRYETSLNPRRVLTKPSKPASNEGFDNEDSDYILYVNDVLGPGGGEGSTGKEEGKGRYLILDVLGQGTFGQVVKCQNLATHEIVAVKVVKNKPAYFQQSMMEVTILELINNQWDAQDEHHMLRLKDTFIHHSHLCLVFELLSNNLYELIKQNSFRGLSTSLVRVFTAQLLDALTVLHEAKIIHCDLKPENILLKSLQSPTIKVIDFGSACHEKQTVYTYIQSRFYRSPEVILSLPYSTSIDMWSLGCICVELFLGLPLFPGTSEFNQITRIVEMLGMPPDHMLEKGKQTSHFFDQVSDEYGRRRWRLKTLERYAAEYKVQEQPSKKYFAATTLPEIIKQYPIVRKGLKEAEVDKEMKNRIAFIDFVKGLLNLDPETRWSPQQARLHPFVLGEQLLQPFIPPPILKSPGGGFSGVAKTSTAPTSPNPAAAVDPKRPYGGLPPNPQRSAPARTYDAKAYSQHLKQQQGYTMQAQQAAQRAAQMPTNPYQLSDGLAQPLQAAPPAGYGALQQQQRTQQSMSQQQAQLAQQQQQAAYGSAFGAGVYPSTSQVGGAGGLVGVGVPANPPAVHHYTTRGRSNTGTQELPPALKKFGQELGVQGGTGQSVTPVLRREDQWQAWERLTGDAQSGVQRRISISRNPHLNLLQEQAENGLNSWNSPMRAKPGQQQQPYSSYYHSPIQGSQPQFSVVVDSRQQQPPGADPFDAGIAAPPLAYSAANPNRYAPYSAGPSAQQSPVTGAGYDLPFDSFDHRMDSLYQPLQPYQSPRTGVPAGLFGPAVQGQQQQQQQQQQQSGKKW